MFHFLCGLFGCIATSLADCKDKLISTGANYNENSPRNDIPAGATPSVSNSGATSMNVDVLLREAAAEMRPQSVTSGCGDTHSLGLVSFRTLLSEIQLVEHLGAGAGGTTWKCRWRTNTVAVKLLVSTSVDQLRASTREAVCSRIVSHPCVVQCYAIHIACLTQQDMQLLTAVAVPTGGTNNGGGGGGSSGGAADNNNEREGGHNNGGGAGDGGKSSCGGGHNSSGKGDCGGKSESGGGSGSGGLPYPPPPLLLCLGNSSTTSLGASALCPTSSSHYQPKHLSQQQQQHMQFTDFMDGGAADGVCLQGTSAIAAAALSPLPTQPFAALAGSGGAYCTDPLLRVASGGSLSDRLPPSPPPAPEAAAAASSAPPADPDGGLEATQVQTNLQQQPHCSFSPSPSYPPVFQQRIESRRAGSGASALGFTCGGDGSRDGVVGEGGIFVETRGFVGRQGGHAAAAAACAAGDAGGWESSTAWWNDGAESGYVEEDPRDQEAELLSELLHLGATPGKFVTAIIMEWCDGGTLHEEFTAFQLSLFGRSGLRHLRLASGHLMSGLGPMCLSPGISRGAGGDHGANRGSGHMYGWRRGGVGSSVSASCRPSIIRGGPSSHTMTELMPCAAAAAVCFTAALPSSSLLNSWSRSLLLSLSSPVCGGTAATTQQQLQAPQQMQLQPPSGGTLSAGEVFADGHMQLAPCGVLGTSTAAAEAAAGRHAMGEVSAVGGSSDPASLLPAVTGSGSRHSAVVLRCALEVAQGMAYLHSLNLAHGDLTPKNVLLKSTATSRRGFTCKISDFGLSHPTSTSRSLPAEMSQWGTLVYMAPEVLTGRSHLKPADVYSFGAILWHMSTGRSPYQELRPAQVLVGLSTGELHLTWPKWVDPRISHIGKACLDPDPMQRPSFEEIVRMIFSEIAGRSARARGRIVGAMAAAGMSTTASAATVSNSSSSAPASAAAAPNSPLCQNTPSPRCPFLTAPPLRSPPDYGFHRPSMPLLQHSAQPQQQQLNRTAGAVSASVARCCEWQPVGLLPPIHGSVAQDTS